jgi:hypothetical protein
MAASDGAEPSRAKAEHKAEVSTFDFIGWAGCGLVDGAFDARAIPAMHLLLSPTPGPILRKNTLS